MHTVFALLCFVVVIHWLIFPYPSGLLHWHSAKQPWWIWINTSCEFIMNDCITTTKQSTTKPCAYFLGYTVSSFQPQLRSPVHDKQVGLSVGKYNLRAHPGLKQCDQEMHIFFHGLGYQCFKEWLDNEAPSYSNSQWWIMSIGLYGTNFGDIWIKILQLSIKKTSCFRHSIW